MKKEINVDYALKKGRARLVHLPMIVTFTFIALSIILSITGIVPKWITIIVFLSGFLFGWLIWSYFVNKWKIWAFENVRNVHELKQKAIDQKLIWESGSWFEKTEFKSPEQKIKLNSLEKKFLEKDFYEDDIEIPKETLIFYSKTSIIFLLIIGVGLISLGSYFLLQKQYFGLFLLAIGLYLTYSQIKKNRDNAPQIIINDRGIKLKNEKIVSWNNIHNDRVFTQRAAKSATNYLAFNNEKVDIDELTVKFDELDKMLKVYRVRFENNSK